MNWVIARNCAATNNLSARPLLASLFSAIRLAAQAGWLPISTDCVFDASLLRVAASIRAAARSNVSTMLYSPRANFDLKDSSLVLQVRVNLPANGRHHASHAICAHPAVRLSRLRPSHRN